MRKFLNKIVVFLCATLFLIIGVGCNVGGGGAGGKTAEQKGRARFNQIPAAVYVIGTEHANGWKISDLHSRLSEGLTFEIKSNGEMVYGGDEIYTLGKYKTENENSYYFYLNSTDTSYDLITISKTDKYVYIS